MINKGYNEKLHWRQQIKKQNSLNRATIKSAFNLLEGYLNGLAFDILITDVERLSENQKKQLKEEINTSCWVDPYSL